MTNTNTSRLVRRQRGGRKWYLPSTILSAGRWATPQMPWNYYHLYFKYYSSLFPWEYLHQIISWSENIFIEEYLHWIPASAPCVDSIIQYVYHLHLNCKPLIHIKTLLGTYRWRELWKIEMYLLKRLTLLGLNKCRRHIVTTTNWKLGSMWILIIVLDIIDHNLIIIWNPYYHIFYTFHVLLIIVHCKIVFLVYDDYDLI